jgi:glycosyltransferase involved in cell wall biosynthesis
MRSVSVIVPVYNHAATVRQAIDSALAQEFEGAVEIIAVNDGSTDLTHKELDSYGSRIKAVRQANRGHAAARNLAVAHSTAEYLAFLDADDIWLPGASRQNRGRTRAQPAGGAP